MKSFQMHKILISAFACTALIACTDASIEEVKETSTARSDYTFGEVLDSPKGCTSTDWDRRDENARPVVQYTCTVDLPQALIDDAVQDNTNRIKTVPAELDKIWQDSLKRLQMKKEDAAKAVVQAGTRQESRIRQGQGALQEAQARLDRALAGTPQQYIGHGPSGYTPQLLAIGRERMQIDIDSAKREVGIAQRKLEEAKADAGPDSAYGVSTSGQGLSAVDYQAMIDSMLSLKDPYYAAINELEARELKRAEEYVSTVKGRELQMRVTFLVPKQFPVEVQSATWIDGGKETKPVNPIYVMSALTDPRQLQELLVREQRARLKFEVIKYELRNTFPFECGEKIPTGCELRKPAS